MALADNGGGGTGGGIGSIIAKAASKTAKTVAKPRTGMGNKPSGTSTRSSGSFRSEVGPPRTSSGSSKSSGGSSSSSSPKPSATSTSKPRPAVPPSINSYLGMDSSYQDILRGGKQTLSDFLADLTRRRGEASSQFDTTVAGMNRDRDTQLQQLRDEFASRGLIQSGLFGEEQGRFQQQFTDQMNALQQQQAGLLADLLSQETNFKREQQLQQEAAKQEALARRAAKYNIGG